MEKKEQRNTPEGKACYAKATSALRIKHREEFSDLLDAEYEAIGMLSPRMKSKAREAERFAAKAAAAERREERRLRQIAEAEATLARLKNDGQDPIF